MKKLKITFRESLLIGGIVCLIIFYIGIALNFVAVKSNDCKMPVYNEIMDCELESHIYTTNKSEINYFHLTDIINMYGYAFSIGDILIILGIIGFITFYINYWVEVYKNGK